MRAEYPSQLDYSGSATCSVANPLCGRQCRMHGRGRLGWVDRSWEQLPSHRARHGGSDVFRRGGRSFRRRGKRAALGIEPRTSRTRSENHTTRPSSRWRNVALADILQLALARAVQAVALSAVCGELPNRKQAPTWKPIVGKMPRPGIEPGTFRSSV